MDAKTQRQRHIMHLSWQPTWSQDLFQKLSEKLCAAFCKFPIFDIGWSLQLSGDPDHLGVNTERLEQSRGSGDGGGKASGIAIAPLFHSHPFGQRPCGGESSFGQTNLIGIFYFHIHPSVVASESKTRLFENNMIYLSFRPLRFQSFWYSDNYFLHLWLLWLDLCLCERQKWLTLGKGIYPVSMIQCIGHYLSIYGNAKRYFE